MMEPFGLDLFGVFVPVYVPFTAPGPELATRVALLPHHPAYVEVRGDTGYPLMLSQLWEKRQTFIVVEQDVVPWPGAIAALEACPEPWCAHAYDTRYEMEGGAPGDAVYLGCVKFASRLMHEVPNAWRCWQTPHWASVDTHISTVLRNAGFDVHQHRPAVTNANPKLLEH